VNVPDRTAVQIPLLRRSRVATRIGDILLGAAAMALIVDFHPAFLGLVAGSLPSIVDNLVLLVAFVPMALSQHWKLKAENLPEDLSGSEYA
jgi:hypothetical protein